MHSASLSTKILLLHGTDDKTVSINESKSSFELLKKLGYDVTFKSYDTGHKISLRSKKYITTTSTAQERLSFLE